MKNLEACSGRLAAKAVFFKSASGSAAKGGKRPTPLLDYLESLGRLQELPLHMIYPGHGEEITKVNELVAKRLEKQRNRAEEVYRILSEKPHSPYQICRKLFPAVYEKELFLTLSETIGQLDDLESQGRIGVDAADGIDYYYAK